MTATQIAASVKPTGAAKRLMTAPEEWRRSGGRERLASGPSHTRPARSGVRRRGDRSAVLANGPGAMTRGIATSHSDHLLEPAGWEPSVIVPRYRPGGT